MARPEDGLDSFERERRQQEKKQKSEARSKKFWSTFLFTENGKPKSGFLIYTFCLAILFFAIQYASFYFIVDWLHPVTDGWPLVLGNLTGSIICSLPALLIGWLLHRWFSDKRLMLGTYIWLALLAAASVITMAFMLKGTGSMPEFITFFCWFAIIPLVLGLIVFYRLYKRDHRPKTPKEEEPEYKKYIRRG
ncbi:MAG: hypothetical protein J5535_01245 [Firmicutes bacterium]|nr:hypothetical protein [Bacillota bacterium]